MGSTTLKVSMAAFFHDIGKFAGKKELEISSQDIDPYDEQLYLKKSNEGAYSHRHALYTALFIEKFSNWLPQELKSPEWGEKDIFTNLAAMHHKPETPMQQIITEADCLSSGWDRDKFDKEYNLAPSVKDYKRTRLLPILEQLNPVEDQQSDSISDYKYRYPLKPVSAENIFPQLKENVVPKNNKRADSEYKDLFNSFVENLKMLSHKEDIELWYEHFDSLMMIYTSHIPAARVGNVVYDVSLYDHCRTTAALATSLYLYHSQTDTFTEKEIRSSKENKFLLINGDFKGIQNFIFSSSADSQKFRSKILRGRSFAVSLLSELAADMLCREIGLPVTSVILNAAGKFTIIAPNITQTRSSVGKVKKKINDWLVKISFGETIFNIAVIEASSNDFYKDKFNDLWDSFNLEMEQE
ncbi:MAG: type III-A CRISPR-associated protein Cas10/Csm1, partial [Desulfobacteraceae bacterium]|nr:type III-A CRISPR-associated protein Cas10/Csm1 [Desulfobacteraceae bacterium]